MDGPTRDELLERIGRARIELDRLRGEGEQAVAERDKNALLNVLMELGKLYFKIPVRDYNAEDVPEGIALSGEVSDLQAALDDQLGLIMGLPKRDRRPLRVASAPGAHTLYR